MNVANLVRAEGEAVAREIIVTYIHANAGLLPLVAALGTAHAMGLEEGIVFALHHPELARRLLAAIDAEGYPDAPPGAVDEQRAQFLIRMVEGMNA